MTRATRPQIHFTPERHWMNDPNGLVFHNGRYHLFYQFNPEGHEHQNMSWGHASSSDLRTWQEHPIAIRFDENEEIYSGSIVVDHMNSSRFGEDGTVPLVAIYTSAAGYHAIQAQSLAYSLDDGMTWEKYEGNPVLDRGSMEFRDPKVFRYERDDEAFWVMVAVEAQDHQVLFYRSDDLRSWTYSSSYGPAGAVGGVWECPDLFPLVVEEKIGVTKWVLLVSLYPGGVSGGSGTQYVVGDFDGRTFTPDSMPPIVPRDSEALTDLDWIDVGRDCYAGVTFNGLPDNRRTLIAWMSNWDYAHHFPTDPWRGAMTLPRRLSLHDTGERLRLRSVSLVGGSRGTDVDPAALADGIPLGDLSGAIRLDAEWRLDEDTTVVIEVRSAAGNLRVSVDCAQRVLRLERNTVEPPFNDLFTGTRVVTIPPDVPLSPLALTAIADNGSLEVFLQDGLLVATNLALTGPHTAFATRTNPSLPFDRLTITPLGETDR